MTLACDAPAAIGRSSPATSRVWGLAAREAHRVMRRQRRSLATAAAILVVNRIASLSLPVAAKLGVDDLTHHGHAVTVSAAVTLAAAAVAVQAISGFALMRMVGRLAGRTMVAIRRDFHARAVRLPLTSLERLRPGVIVSGGTTDAEQVGAVLAVALVPLASSILTATGALALLASVSGMAALCAVLAVAGAAVALSRVFAHFADAFAEVGAANAGLADRLTETLGTIQIIKASGAERQESHAFVRAAHRHFRAFGRATNAAATLATASSILTGGAGVLLLAAGSRAVQIGAWTLGDLTLVALLVGLLTAPIVQIAALTRELGEAAATLVRIGSFRALPTEDEEDRWRRRLRRPALDGLIRVEHVQYTYPSGHVALRDVSLTATPGSMTGLVGCSGSGKSTMCRLLADLDRPKRGRIVVDGLDLATVRRRDYRGQVGVVLQDQPLVAASVADNIRYGRYSAAIGEVREAANRAQCHEFIEGLPHGYDTLVGRGGASLSAGERQRIALARVILANPRIIIFDEITSHLDAETEAKILNTVSDLREGRTLLVIAHRLSTVRDADQILVLDHGIVAERGDHSVLMARRGRYHRLYTLQHPDARGNAALDTQAWTDESPDTPPWTRDIDWGLIS